MKVFISWSGPKSKVVAVKLNRLIGAVLQRSRPWMSDKDINAGKRWSQELGDELDTTKYGIICLTPDNLNAPWILFEAGAIAKSLSDSHLCPYLINLEPADVPQGPLAQFQSIKANKGGTLKLLSSINSALEAPVKKEYLEYLFEELWPAFQKVLNSIPNTQEKTERGERDMLGDILNIARSLDNRYNAVEEKENENLRSILNNQTTSNQRQELIIQHLGIQSGRISPPLIAGSVSAPTPQSFIPPPIPQFVNQKPKYPVYPGDYYPEPSIEPPDDYYPEPSIEPPDDYHPEPIEPPDDYGHTEPSIEPPDDYHPEPSIEPPDDYYPEPIEPPESS